MSILGIIEITLAVLGGLGALLAGGGYAWGQIQQGRNQSKLDEGNDKLNTNSLLKEQIDALESKVNRQSDEIKNLTDRVKMLTASIDEERKKFAEAILTIQGKDPQIIEFIGMAKSYFELNRPLLDKINHEVVPTVERLGKYLDHQSF